MAKPWDDMLKRLIQEHPQDFVALMLPDCQIVRRLSENLKNHDRVTDALYLAKLPEGPMIVHIECQRRNDYHMKRRLREYSVLASSENDDLPVLSCVIYLIPDGNVVDSPIIDKLPNGKEYSRLYFVSIKLWEIHAEDLLHLGLHGLLPLVFLTKGGKQPEIVEQTIAQLGETGEETLLALGYLMGSLVFTKETEREALKRRFRMFDDMLKDTWAYKEIMEEGYTEGIKKGIKEGIEQERQQRIEDHRRIITTYVQARFPTLTLFAKKQVYITNDLELLEKMVNRLFLAQSIEEAQQLLDSIHSNDIN